MRRARAAAHAPMTSQQHCRCSGSLAVCGPARTLSRVLWRARLVLCPPPCPPPAAGTASPRHWRPGLWCTPALWTRARRPWTPAAAAGAAGDRVFAGCRRARAEQRRRGAAQRDLGGRDARGCRAARQLKLRIVFKSTAAAHGLMRACHAMHCSLPAAPTLANARLALPTPSPQGCL